MPKFNTANPTNIGGNPLEPPEDYLFRMVRETLCQESTAGLTYALLVICRSTVAFAIPSPHPSAHACAFRQVYHVVKFPDVFRIDRNIKRIAAE